MSEMDHGLTVKSFRDLYYVTYDSNTKQYGLGQMLLEVLEEGGRYYLTKKVENAIHYNPLKQEPVTPESVSHSFDFLLGTMIDDELPVASALFESSFFESIKYVLSSSKGASCETIESLFEMCFDNYLDGLNLLRDCSYVWALHDSGNASDNDEDLFYLFQEYAEEQKATIIKKPLKNTGIPPEGTVIKSWLDLLAFEYCTLQDKNKKWKICLNCQRYFVPYNRRTVFCDRPISTESGLTCKNVGPRKKYNRKLANNPIEKKKRNEESRLLMNALRARRRGESDEYYLSKLNKVKSK